MKFSTVRLRKQCSVPPLFELPLFPLWLAPLILLSPVYLTGKALFWGTPLLQFGPWWSYAWQTLLSGHLPLWNPLLGMGAPLLANYQSALFYPPNWLYLLLYALGGAPWMAWGMALVAALHLVWAGVGMANLARRMGSGILAQTVSGLAFGMSGYLVARLGFLSITSTVTWLPWVLLYLTPGAGKPWTPRQDYLKRTTCLVMLLLAGHAQTAWYTLLLAGVWAGYWAIFSPSIFENDASRQSHPGWQAGFWRVAKTWWWFGLSLILAIGVCAVQLIPTAEYLAQSQRATAVDYGYALNYSFWPWHLLTALAPGFFGSPASADYWGASNYWEDAFYIGLLPLILAAGALVNSLRRRARIAQPRRNLAWFLTSLIGVSLLLALGKHTPIFPWLYWHIPTFAMFQAPARWLVWSEFALAMLAGLGAQRWRQPQGWGLYWARLWSMGAVAIALGAGLAWYAMGDISPTFIRATALVGFFGVGIGVLSLTAPPQEAQPPAIMPDTTVQSKQGNARRRLIQLAPPTLKPRDPAKPYRLGIWQAAVAAWVGLDLLVAGWGLNPAASSALYAPSPVASQLLAQAQGGRLYLPKKQEDWLKYERFLHFNAFIPGEDWLNLRAVTLPNTNMLDNLPSTNNFDPFLPARYTDWFEMLDQVSPAVYERMLRLMGVGVIESLDRQQSYGVRYEPASGVRARWLECARLANDATQARNLVLSGQVDFEREVVLEGLTPPEKLCPPAAPESEPTDETNFVLEWAAGQNPNRIEICLDAPSAGWLAISDVWYPGWRAWVDGKPVALLRANYLFRAVQIPAGKHQIALVYQPLSFWGGAAFSLVSILAAMVIYLRQRRSNPASRLDDKISFVLM